VVTTSPTPVLTDHDRDDVRPQPAPPLAATLALAVAAGAALGVVDLLLQRTLPYPWADLANSSAVWAVFALLLPRALGTGPWRSVLAGVVSLVVAVEAYYLAAIATDLADWSRLTSPSTVAWVVMGVVAGAGFGLAGAWTRSGASWRAAAGTAVGVAVLLSEAWLRIDLEGTALLTAALGVALLGLVARRPRQLGRTLLLVVPMVPVCHVLFGFAGFGI
jgi:hypothetical protein